MQTGRMRLDKPAIIEPDGDGFNITRFSGGQTILTHETRDSLRQFIEHARLEIVATEAQSRLRSWKLQ